MRQEEAIKQVAAVKAKIAVLVEAEKEAETATNACLHKIGNLVHDSAVSDDEENNVVYRSVRPRLQAHGG